MNLPHHARALDHQWEPERRLDKSRLRRNRTKQAIRYLDWTSWAVRLRRNLPGPLAQALQLPRPRDPTSSSLSSHYMPPSQPLPHSLSNMPGKIRSEALVRLHLRHHLNSPASAA